MVINSLRPRQNGRHFKEGIIFKCIFLNENCWISNIMPLKCVPYGLIDNVIIGSDNGFVLNRQQAVIWSNSSLVYSRIYASLGLNELMLTIIPLKSSPEWESIVSSTDRSRICFLVCMIIMGALYSHFTGDPPLWPGDGTWRSGSTLAQVMACLCYHHRCSVAFTWEQFLKNYSWTWWVACVRNLHF